MEVDNTEFDTNDINSVESLGLIEVDEENAVMDNLNKQYRYIIEYLTVENFKSYAGVNKLGPFHNNFSCIVGPNGSGKSNIIDAILFVFGFRAQKIRSKNLAVLIHKSCSFPNLQQCSVSIDFKRLNVDSIGDSHSFSIRRTVNRDGVSNYYFGTEKISAKEVTQRLKHYGIGIQNNRFLILQGEVEQISLMKPLAAGDNDEGMLEYLEDIIGTNRFKRVIDIYELRIAKLSEARVTMFAQTKQSEIEKNELKEARDEAINYLNLINSQTVSKFRLYKKHTYDLQKQISGDEEEMKALKKDLDSCEEKLRIFYEKKTVKSKDYSQIQRDFKQANKVGADARQKFKKLEYADIKIREEQKHNKAELAKVRESVKQQTSSIEDCNRQTAANDEKQTELGEYLVKLKDDHVKNNNNFQIVLDELKSTTKPVQLEIQKQEKKLTELQTVADTAKHNYDIAESEFNLFKSETEVAETKASAMEKQLSDTTETLNLKKESYSRHLERLAEISPEIGALNSSYTELREKINKLNSNIGVSRNKIEEMKSFSSASKSRSFIMKTFMEEKRQGRLPGIIGRLGDLGMIDAKYDVAISTACSRLDNIVVDDYETAEKAIQLLKVRNLGSYTFIVLDIINKMKSESLKPFNGPTSALRLYDLIRPTEDRFKVAFFFAIGNTLVTEDIDKASAVAFGAVRYRVVTLDGQLIETSGTLSGGGTRRVSNKMGLSSLDYNKGVNASTLLISEQKLESMVNDIADLESKGRDINSNIERLDSEKKTNEHMLERLKLEIRGCEESITLSKSKIVTWKKKAALVVVDKKAVARYKIRLEDCQSELGRQVKVADDQRVVVEGLYAKLTAIRGSRFAIAQKAVDETTSRLSAVNAELDKLSLEHRKNEMRIKKAVVSLESFEAEVTQIEERLKKIHEEITEIDQKAAELIQANKDSTDNAVLLGNKLKELQEELDSMTSEEGDLRRGKISLQGKYDTMSELVNDCLAKIEHWKSELGKLSIKEVDGVIDKMPIVSDKDMDALNVNNIETVIKNIEKELKIMNPNMAAIHDYKEKEEMYLNRVDVLERLTAVRNEQHNYLEVTRKNRLNEFMLGFEAISLKLKEMYQMITLGGDAELELVDSLNPFSEGVIFSVRPPRKTWKNISNLSGGEKTMSSLALVFALHHYKPSPLYVMDEIDAALDYRNVSIIAHYIKKWTLDAQFIIISLRSHMFELSNRLVGVYKNKDCTSIVVFDP